MATGVRAPTSGATTTPPHDGRIALRLTIGVVGHRRLPDPHRVAKLVRGRLEEIREHFAPTATTGIHYTVLSPLAEGADRLVAREALDLFGAEAELVAVLPLEPDDYADDFETPESKAEFDDWLERAASVTLPVREPRSREDAYWRAGRAVVDRSDVVIAVWDGQPARGVGGTEHVIAYAESRSVPVLLIMTEPEPAHAGAETRWPRSAERAWDRLREYNDADPRWDERRREIEEAECARDHGIEDAGARALYEAARTWAAPYYARAEARATTGQRRYFLAGDLLYVLAAFAVAAVALQNGFLPEHPQFSLLETAALVGLVLVFRHMRPARLHDTWIEYRSLAELLRSAPFLACVGADEVAGLGSAAGGAPASEQPWFQRAFGEAWRTRPPGAGDGASVAALRQLLLTTWIKPQIKYHESKAEGDQRRHERVTRLVKGFLWVAIVLSLLHALRVAGEDNTAARMLVFLAIALPGVSAALTGHREQHQYRWHAGRSRQAARRLRLVQAQMEAVSDIAALRHVASEAHALMVAENADWHGVVELQELEAGL